MAKVLVSDVKRAARNLGVKIADCCYFDNSEGLACPLAVLTYDGVRRNIENLEDELVERRIDKKFGAAFSAGFIAGFDNSSMYNIYVGKAKALYVQGYGNGQKLRKSFIK